MVFYELNILLYFYLAFNIIKEGNAIFFDFDFDDAKLGSSSCSPNLIKFFEL